MSPTGNGAKDSVILLPHQTALVETFFNHASKRVILLRWDVGLGKTVALVALSSRLLHDRPTALVLFLVPAALQYQTLQMLSDASVPSLLIDRYRFREMLDAAAGKEIWPRGVVLVMSLDFAKQPDVRDSLAEAHLELVIADDAASTSGARAEVLRWVGASAERMVLAGPPSLIPEEMLQTEDPLVVELHREQIVDKKGMPFYAVPRFDFREISFGLNEAELRLRKTVGDLCEMQGNATEAGHLKATMLLRSLESSPAALERALQRFLDKTTMDSAEHPVESWEGAVLEEDTPRTILDRGTSEKTAGIAARALQEIESITDDSKLAAFASVLTQLKEMKTLPPRICVLTDFRATLYYLAAEIEGRGRECYVLHGGMQAEERIQSLMPFTNAGGILVATTAVMTAGIDLSSVAHLILYDIPGRRAMQQVLGRFNRYGRPSELKIYVLTTSNGQTSLVSKSLGLLREILGTS